MKVASKKFKKCFVPIEEVVTIHRRYYQAKSFNLKRIIVTLTQGDSPSAPYVAVIYRADSIDETFLTMPHGNSKKEKPYIRTDPAVLKEAKNLLSNKASYTSVYDELNQKTGGSLQSKSQSMEVRNYKQLYNQKQLSQEIVEKKDELTRLIDLQRADMNFLKTVCCLSKSYYAFLSTEEQLEDIVKFCCLDGNVLAIDTTFNLCSNWLTDTCYHNKRLVNSEGKHPVFLGPCFLHFEKSTLFFNRFFKEMCSFNSGIKDLKVLGTDNEKTIFNGFKSDADDLKLLLCVSHLEKADREKLKSFASPKDKGKGISGVIKDIYGFRYGTVMEYGLADSIDPEDLKNGWMMSKINGRNLSLDFINGS